MTTGTLVAGFWNEQTTELIRTHTLGEPQAARREVLRALEDAPNFEKAQELGVMRQTLADWGHDPADRPPASDLVNQVKAITH